MKTAGIVADNYKLERFKKELTKDGFLDFEIFPFTKDTSTIKVQVPENKQKDLKKICLRVELHFNHSN